MKYITGTHLSTSWIGNKEEKTTLLRKEFHMVSEFENNAWQLSRHESAISVSLMRSSPA
jgi:hypothetical protein